MGKNSRVGKFILDNKPSRGRANQKGSSGEDAFRPGVQSLRVHEIMSFPVVTANVNDDLKRILTKMLKHEIASVVITDKSGSGTGIITQGDIIRFFASSNTKSNLFSTKAKELMSTPLIFIDGDTELEAAAKRMVEHKVKKLCVRDANNNLIGMLTDNDIMKNASYLIDVLIEMVETGYIKG